MKTALFVMGMIAISGALYGADDANSPASRQMQLNNQMIQGEDYDNSPLSQAQDRARRPFPSEDHRNAYDELSTKNKIVYDSLSRKDQEKIARSYKEGYDPQRTLVDILEEDQEMGSMSMEKEDEIGKNPEPAPGVKAMTWENNKAGANANSPASRSMKVTAPSNSNSPASRAVTKANTPPSPPPVQEPVKQVSAPAPKKEEPVIAAQPMLSPAERSMQANTGSPKGSLAEQRMDEQECDCDE